MENASLEKSSREWWEGLLGLSSCRKLLREEVAELAVGSSVLTLDLPAALEVLFHEHTL
jgi:hypothetical protein